MRRFTLLLVGAVMAALMLAVAGVAWAVDDTTPPTVVSTTPADDETGFDRDASIKVKFSEAMMKDTINRRHFYFLYGTYSYEDLNSESGGVGQTTFGFDVRYNAQKRIVTLDPSVRLDRRETYTVWVEGGGDPDRFAVKDRAGNELAADYIWHFTTGAN